MTAGDAGSGHAVADGAISENGPLDDDAQNVVLVQRSSELWEVVVSGSETLVGRITKVDDGYAATDARENELGVFGSAELAMFGLVNPA